MQQNNDNLTLCNENSMADVLQQEVAQRLLAIRMNAALYSRRNEGRKTQELADQAVNMADEVIKQFEYLLHMMRLPRYAFDEGLSPAIALLKQSIEQISPLQCSFDVQQNLDSLSASDAFFVFQILHAITLQLMLDAGKSPVVTISLSIDGDTSECLLVVYAPDSNKQLVFLRAILQRQTCSTVQHDAEKAMLRLALPVSSLTCG